MIKKLDFSEYENSLQLFLNQKRFTEMNVRIVYIIKIMDLSLKYAAKDSYINIREFNHTRDLMQTINYIVNHMRMYSVKFSKPSVRKTVHKHVKEAMEDIIVMINKDKLFQADGPILSYVDFIRELVGIINDLDNDFAVKYLEEDRMVRVEKNVVHFIIAIVKQVDLYLRTKGKYGLRAA